MTPRRVDQSGCGRRAARGLIPAARVRQAEPFHRRNHRRAIVIDGRTGYTGGMAVVDHWLGDARNPDEWRDTMVRVTGCLSESLQSAFAELWAYVTGEILTGDAFFPEEYDVPSSIRSFGVVSAPASEQHPLSLLFFLTIVAARDRLWINTPYFAGPEHAARDREPRARRCGRRLLLPGPGTDMRAVRRAATAITSVCLMPECAFGDISRP
jgi:cardiolipin synthase